MVYPHQALLALALMAYQHPGLPALALMAYQHPGLPASVLRAYPRLAQRVLESMEYRRLEMLGVVSKPVPVYLTVDAELSCWVYLHHLRYSDLPGQKPRHHPHHPPPRSQNGSHQIYLSLNSLGLRRRRRCQAQ